MLKRDRVSDAGTKLRAVLALGMTAVMVAFVGCAPPMLEPWELALHHVGSRATLEESADAPGRIRVDISQADDPTGFHIQLNQAGHVLEKDQPYRLSFRARADSPRSAFVAVSMAHAPWESLGFYREVALTDAWQVFDFEFVPDSSDGMARVHFDPGASSASVELEDIVLQPVSE